MLGDKPATKPPLLVNTLSKGVESEIEQDELDDEQVCSVKDGDTPSRSDYEAHPHVK